MTGLEGTGAGVPGDAGGADAARRLAAGPPPSGFLGRAAAPGTPSHDGERPPSRSTGAGGDHSPSSASSIHGDASPSSDAPYDPLSLCVYATIALLGWLAGPAALVVFAAVGFAGYWRARRAGLTRSKCWLRDTRLVLAYLAALTAAGLWGVWSLATRIWGG